MSDANPAHRPGARPFDGWTLDDTATQITAHWTPDGDPAGSFTRLFLSDEPDAVRLVVVVEPLTPGLEDEPAWPASSATAILAAPLGDRPVIDETTGEVRPQLGAQPRTEVADGGGKKRRRMPWSR